MLHQFVSPVPNNRLELKSQILINPRWTSVRNDLTLAPPRSLQGDQVYKSVFIIFFQGEQLKTRVKKICEGFRATLYPCPETPSDRREMKMGVMTRIEDLNTVSVLGCGVSYSPCARGNWVSKWLLAFGNILASSFRYHQEIVSSTWILKILSDYFSPRWQ